jgi:hypothetical protein
LGQVRILLSPLIEGFAHEGREVASVTTAAKIRAQYPRDRGRNR